MIGQPAFTFSFSRKDKAITLEQTSAIRVAPDQTIDFALLFPNRRDSIRGGYALRAEFIPPPFFESRDIFRKADKPQLGHAIYEHGSDAILRSVPETESHVLDGGFTSSPNTMEVWAKLYGEIAQSYADFTLWHYGSATTVVLDGYEEGPSIKDNIHQRPRMQ